jgi:hypothetical protein
VGWLRLRHAGPLSATASNAELRVTVHDHHRLGRQPVVVECSHPCTFASSTWSLPGRTIGYVGPSADDSGTIDAGGDEDVLLRF